MKIRLNRTRAVLVLLAALAWVVWHAARRPVHVRIPNLRLPELSGPEFLGALAILGVMIVGIVKLRNNR
ncbi:MAG TPA: hypothetical protein PLF11_14455 [Bacillota bacterium]|mgnify:FL=1|jgi:hypothetical protein|nr:hypothetical protein [Bacillota bacterium]